MPEDNSSTHQVHGHNGGGNPNHDPKTGRFTSGQQDAGSSEIVVIGRHLKSSSAPGPHWTVKDSSVEVPDLIRRQVDDVAKDYYAATKKDLVVTDGPRSPHDQAKRMFYKYSHGDFKTYRGWFGRQIADAYLNGIANKTSSDEIVGDMAELISRYLKQGHPISAHLVDRAVDFSWHGMTQSDKAELTKAIEKNGGNVAKEGTPPHTHATFRRR